MVANVSQFLDSLVEQRILSSDSLRRFDSSLINAAADFSQWLDPLVQRKLLTSFQADAIRRGESHSLVLGNYVLLDKIGAGGMGEVYKARHGRMDRIVAVKILPAHTLSAAGTLERFQREVRAVAKLDHPNIVTAFDADEVKGVPFLVMQYVDGPDLATVVRRHGPLQVGQVIDIALQTAKGLEYAHGQGIVHRDIKPSNLLIDSRGAIKILDMGLARFSEPDVADSDLTKAGDVMGTLDFMAPEQAEDSHHADARSDLYSLGCTMYWLFTAKPVYGGRSATQKFLRHRETPVPPLRQTRPEIPQELDGIYQRMMAKHPEDRFQSATEIIIALESLGISDPCGVTESFHLAHAADSAENSTSARERFRATDTLSELRQATTSRVSTAARPRRIGLWIGIPLTVATGIILALAMGWFGRAPLSSSVGRAMKAEDNTETNMTTSPVTSASRAAPPIAFAPFSESQAVDYRKRWADYLGLPGERLNARAMRLVLIPPGAFLMGATRSDVDASEDERPAHRVEISDAFYLSTSEVTVAQFREFVDATSYVTTFEKSGGGFQSVGGIWTRSPDLNWRMPGYVTNDQMPVTQVTHEDATSYCRWLSSVEKETYRLPTEAEWEFACRAGTETAWSFGDSSEKLPEYVVCNTSGPEKPAVIQSLLPNPFGLYDMHGNVWEFCFDTYSDSYYEAASRMDPHGSLDNDAYSVRGGSWIDSADLARSSNRSRFRGGGTTAGFRVALSVSAASEPVSERLRRGIEQHRRGEYASAIRGFTEVLSLQPKNIDALMHRGSSYLSLREADRAAADFSDVIQISPDYVMAYSYRGDAFYLTRDYARAQADYSESLRRKPRSGVLHKRARCFVEQREYTKALADLNLVIAHVPDDAEVLTDRAYVHRMLGNWESCIQDTSQAIKLAPGIGQNFGNRCYAYMRLGKLDEALSDAEQRIKILPKSYYGYFLKGMVLVKRQQESQAIAVLDEAIRLSPKSSSAYLWRAKAYDATGDLEKAAGDRAKAREINPHSSIADDE